MNKTEVKQYCFNSLHFSVSRIIDELSRQSGWVELSSDMVICLQIVLFIFTILTVLTILAIDATSFVMLVLNLASNQSHCVTLLPLCMTFSFCYFHRSSIFTLIIYAAFWLEKFIWFKLMLITFSKGCLVQTMLCK